MKPALGARRALIVAASIAALVVVATGAASPQAGPSRDRTARHLGRRDRRPYADRKPWDLVGRQPITYKFQWLRCQANAGDDSSTSSCTSISGGTRTTYTAASSDLGFRLRFRVKASNKQGSAQSTSAATSVVTTEGGTPANSAPPTISGSASVGATLTASTGSSVGDQPITYSYQWQK